MLKMGMISLLLCAGLSIVLCTNSDSLSQDEVLKGSSVAQPARDQVTDNWDEEDFFDEENEENDYGMVKIVQQT